MIFGLRSWQHIDPPRALFLASSAMLFTSVPTLLACLIVKAPYGRYSTNKGWGPLLSPKFAWVVMEAPNLWVPPLVYIYQYRYTIYSQTLKWASSLNSSLSITSLLSMDFYKSLISLAVNLYLQFPSIPLVNLLLFTPYTLHYVHRSLIYPLFLPPSSAPMPASVTFLAWSYCVWNGFVQAMSLLIVQSYSNAWIYDPRFVLGLFIWAIGAYINIQSDYHLLSLRNLAKKEALTSERKEDKGGRRYIVPTKGMFQYVSCANYFGEIVEWIGFAIACWSLSGLAFAAFTISNLLPRAIKHHSWYIEKFEDYPRNRKAVIPFIL